MDFTRICGAFKTVGILESEQKTIFSILAAIIHLGYAGTSKGKSEKLSMADEKNSCTRYDADTDV